ncbi:MAG: hypothetical protein HGA96_07970 [Desulfobulbaceae bacterium]|nr:hypothetical protein [Desulfobulbaceae bacterium]
MIIFEKILGLAKETAKGLLKGLVRSRVAVAGALVSVLIMPVLFISILLDMHGVVNNPYFGFLIYMVMGPLFVAGLVTVAVGLFLFRDKEEIGLYALEYIREQMSMPGRFIRVRRLIYLSSFLTFFTLVVIGVVSYAGFNYTESVRFCGQFCHTVMEPEYITYQNSAHSRVPCVNCHIGASAGGFTKSKISGVRMIFATFFGRFSQPIITPISSLRPTREVCEECHRPEKFHGDKLYVKDAYLPDAANTHVQTVLLMRVGSGGYRGQVAQGIHWHVSPQHFINFEEDPTRVDTIKRIKMVDHDGSVVLYQRGADQDKSGERPKYRLMDCLDCHNRPTHVFLSPDEALDTKIATGAIPLLPYVKKLGLELVQRSYSSKEQARRMIAEGVEEWYRKNYPEQYKTSVRQVTQAGAGIFQAWAENVFPDMKITWGTYTSRIGHRDEKGCFRCHTDELLSREGRVISHDCNLCHVVLADRQPAPDIMRILQGSGGPIGNGLGKLGAVSNNSL